MQYITEIVMGRFVLLDVLMGLVMLQTLGLRPKPQWAVGQATLPSSDESMGPAHAHTSN